MDDQLIFVDAQLCESCNESEIRSCWRLDTTFRIAQAVGGAENITTNQWAKAQLKDIDELSAHLGCPNMRGVER